MSEGENMQHTTRINPEHSSMLFTICTLNSKKTRSIMRRKLANLNMQFHNDFLQKKTAIRKPKSQHLSTGRAQTIIVNYNVNVTSCRCKISTKTGIFFKIAMDATMKYQ